MGFSIATNFDDDLPGLVAPYGAVDLFGKLPRDAIGGGRASYMIAPTSQCRLTEHVKKTHESGLEFNYLANTACMGNQEFTATMQKSIRLLLDWLSEINVDWLTVSVPYLLELVKSRYPHFKVKIGVFAGVDTPRKAQFYERLGADCITLQAMAVNRDFKRLEAIRKSVQCDLQLIANSNCLLECPIRLYHNVGLSHASQTGSKGFHIDYCLLRCLVEKLRDPVNYIKSPWIRPEDLHYYESIGYTSFKILERDAPTQTMLRRVRAYHERRFDGNLLDLVQCYGYKESKSSNQPKRRPIWEFWEFVRPWHVNPQKLLPWKELAKLQGMIYRYEGEPYLYIDNQALDGFMDKFIASSCTNLDCADCRHCYKYMESALRIDSNYSQRCIDLALKLLNELSSGGMWRRW